MFGSSSAKRSGLNLMKMTDWVWEIILVIYRLGETLNTKV